MKPLVLADIDGTLAVNGSGAPPSGAYVLHQGDRYWTAQLPWQSALTGWLLDAADLVPVTLRSPRALDSLSLPLRSWTVCAGGAWMAEPDGTPHGAWAAHVDRAWNRAGGDRAEKRIAALGQGHVTRPRGGLKVLFLRGDQAFIDRAAETAGPDMHAMRASAGKCMLAPRGISKRDACIFLLGSMRIDAGRPVIAMGDSLSDLPFMDLAHMACAPAGSEIAGRMDGSGSERRQAA